jgi:hypothetical protein
LEMLQTFLSHRIKRIIGDLKKRKENSTMKPVEIVLISGKGR